MTRVAAVSYRIFGEPPAKGASAEQRLRWIRRIYLRLLPMNFAAWALVIIYVSSTLVLVFVGISALIWVQGFVSITLRIRREQRRAQT
jgi:hypothetical protein